MKFPACLLLPFSLVLAAPHLPEDEVRALMRAEAEAGATAAGDSSGPAKAGTKAGDNSGADAKAGARPQGLDALEKELNETFARLRGRIDPVPELYPEAKARLARTRFLQNERPGKKETLGAARACSVWTRAAVLQLKTLEQEAAIRALEGKRRQILTQLNQVYDQIIQLEKGNASKLRAQLEAEQRKARERREEAARRFDQLQSELINVKKDARGTIISMSDILFDVDKATLKPDLKTNLAKIAGILTIYKEAHVMVEGHTDNSGSEEYNQKLSERRAQNVMDFLIGQGVATPRLKAIGYGLTRPIADNSTKEGRQKNRRVDLVVQEKQLK